MVGEGQLTKKNIINNKVFYSGLSYDIWNNIKKNLEKDYSIKEFFIETEDYSGVIKKVSKGEYDIAIAPYTVTTDRLEIVNFTRPILINKLTIIYKDKVSFIKKVWIILKKVILKPLLILFILGIILGFLVDFLEPDRYKKIGFKKAQKLKSSIYTILAALFGETGMLFENTDLSITGVILVMSIALIAMISLITIQAEATVMISSILKNESFNIDNIKDKKLLTPKGYKAGFRLKSYGTEIIESDTSSIKETIKIYLKNTDEYDGIPLDMSDALEFNKEFNLLKSDADLGIDEIAFASVRNNDQKLLRMMNLAIRELHDRHKISDYCKIYLRDEFKMCSL